MNYLIFLLFLVISFFVLHALARRDFVLLRKNISLSSMFDLGIIILIVGYTIGRIFYILDNRMYTWIHIIRFFHFIRLPGVSAFGTVLGILLGVLIFLKQKKALLRVIDIISLSFLPLYVFDILIRSYPAHLLLLKMGTLGVFLIVFYLLLICNKNFSLKDGSITLIVLLVIALDTLMMRYYHLPKVFLFIFSFSEWVSVLTVICTIVLLLYNEKMLLKKN